MESLWLTLKSSGLAFWSIVCRAPTSPESPHHLTQASEIKHSDIGQMATPTSPDAVVVIVLESLQCEELFQRVQGQWPHSAAGQVAEEKSSVSPCGHVPRLWTPIRPVDDPLEQWGFEG